ncbi:MAG: T9SS type A sorting domain-containing protein [Saprospiraceae bacterium]|nr:T9SS type A sorting domain-containing protein [Candidatus Opimibacter skivensis]
MITVQGVGDLNIETDESFTVTLGSITGAPAGVTTAGSPQTGTLLNDELDWSDAPIPYPTLLANNSPRHTQLPGGLRLGATVDAEVDGQPNATATGDGADEDGVTLPSAIVINTTANITVNASGAGVLNAWVDFNLDGDWADAGEQIFINQAVVAGNNALSFAVPGGASLGNSFGRFRISTASGLSFTGAATDGEVEDYAINIVNTQFSIDDPTVVEGNAGTSNLVFTISRTVNANACSIDYAITGGTATTADLDYQPLAAGTLNFTAGGAFTQTVTVLVNGDNKVELNETVIMTLSNPVNASILDGSGTGTITNDDSAIITISNPSLAEGCTGSNPLITFNVSMSNPSDASVTYNFNTIDGTATLLNNDYFSASGSTTLNAGTQQGTMQVTLVGDCFIEPNETFLSRLSNLNTNGRAITFSGGGATLDGTGTILNDDSVPQITCPGNVTVQCAALVPPANTSSVSSTDNCGNPATITFVGDVISNQTCPNRYTVTRTYLATDACNNTSTCTQIITVFDDTPPMLTCPAGVTVQCAALVPAPNIALVTSTDNCAGTAAITHVGDVISNQTCANRYTLTRTYRATDLCGNSATCNQIITVFDNTPPMMTCPANLTVQCASLVPAPNTALVTSTDNCIGTAVITFVSDVISNQTCPNRYTLTRTYRATDLCGNSTTCAQIITVFDNTAPSITCPANLTVQCASLVPVPDPGSVITSDNCGGTTTVMFVSDAISNQTCVNRFIVTRTYRATDACGNSSTCTQVITVFDNTAPVITFADPLLQGIPNGGTVKVQCLGQDPAWEIPELGAGSITTSDNCAGTVTVSFTDMLLDEGDCATDGYINRYRLNWTATDACGNSSTAFVFLELVDEIPPVFEGIPADTVVSCDAIPAPPVVTATDECLCACDITMVESQPLPGCQDGQIITRTWTTSDLCGNVSTAIQYITLKDEKGPVLILTPPQLAGISQNTTFEYTCNEGGIPAFFESLNVGSVMSPPSCGNIPTITFKEATIIARNCEFSGYAELRTYQWTGTDACGNTTILTIEAKLIDNEAPVIIGVPEITCVGDPALDDIEVIDNCGYGNYKFWDVQVPNPCGTGNAIRRTYEGFDGCGNTVRDTAILLPDDNVGPEMEFVNPILAALQPGDVLTIDCGTSEDQYTLFGVDDVHAEDACSEGLSVTFNEKVTASGDCASTGIIVSLILEWTATDICGNNSMLTARINIVDQTPPTFPGFKPEVTIGCDETLPEIMVTDNCQQQIIVTTVDSIIAGDCEFEYDVRRRINAIDACGNSTSVIQLVHVGDGSGPIIEGVVAELCDDLSLPVVTAFDDCAGRFVPVTMVQDTLDTECRDGLVIRRTWSAKDLCGNASTVQQTIVLNDTEAPEILIPTWSVIRRYLDNQNNKVSLSQTGIMDQLNALDDGSVYVEDECDLQIVPVFTLQSTLTDDCEAAGYYERRVYTWVATDVCGNATVITFSVDVIDDLPPVISGVPANMNLTCAPLPAVPSVLAEDTAQPVSISYTETILPGNQPGQFIVRRLWVATDACGNSSQAEQLIRWTPNTFVECAILLPPPVECSTHGVVISSIVTDGVAPYTYVWALDGDDYLLQSGQGTPQITIYIGFSPVDISLTVTDSYGCETVCTAILDCEDPLGGFVSNPSEIMEIETKPSEEILHSEKLVDIESNLQKVSFWPNPVSETLNLSFTTSKDQDVHLRLVNTMGQTVKSADIHGITGRNEYALDVANLTEGSYVIELQTDKEIYSRVILLLRNK